MNVAHWSHVMWTMLGDRMADCRAAPRATVSRELRVLSHYGLLKSFPNGQFEANLWRGAELCLGSCLVKKQACQALCCLQTLSAKGSFIELGLGQ